MLQPKNSQSELVLPGREGYRTRRDGFPAERSLNFSLSDWETRFEYIAHAETTGASYRASLTSKEFCELGFRALYHIRQLAEANQNQCPTLYELLSSLAKDRSIGGITSRKFEQVAQLLCSRLFTSAKFGQPLWIGRIDGIADCITTRLTGRAGRYRGLSIVNAVIEFSEVNKRNLFTSSSVINAFGLSSDKTSATRLLSNAFQLLAQSGHLVRHPDHLNPATNRMVGVWSSKSTYVLKPEIANPEQAVLSHAADPKNGWLFDLYSNSRGNNGIFLHHTILAAARRLKERGLIKLTDKFISEKHQPPNGPRFYKNVALTNAAKDIVLPWHEVEVGGKLNQNNYEPLRNLLVERAVLPRRNVLRLDHSNNCAASKIVSTRSADG